MRVGERNHGRTLIIIKLSDSMWVIFVGRILRGLSVTHVFVQSPPREWEWDL